MNLTVRGRSLALTRSRAGCSGRTAVTAISLAALEDAGQASGRPGTGECSITVPFAYQFDLPDELVEETWEAAGGSNRETQ